MHYGKAFESLHASPGAQLALGALVCLGRVLWQASGLCRGGARKRSQSAPFSRVSARCGRYEFRRFPLVVISTQTKPPRASPKAASSFLPPAVLPLPAPPRRRNGQCRLRSARAPNRRRGIRVFIVSAVVLGARKAPVYLPCQGPRGEPSRPPRASAPAGPSRSPLGPLARPPRPRQGPSRARQGPRVPAWRVYPGRPQGPRVSSRRAPHGRPQGPRASARRARPGARAAPPHLLIRGDFDSHIRP